MNKLERCKGIKAVICTSTLKIRKREQIKTKMRRKEIVKIATAIAKLKTQNTREKINGPIVDLLERLVRLVNN
jgi:hypothetical protein